MTEPHDPPARRMGLFRSGEPWIWITGAALGASLLMVLGLIALILWNGLGFFWPADLVVFTLKDGAKTGGRLEAREKVPQPDVPAGTPVRYRVKLKQANRDVYGNDFLWVDEDQVTRRDVPRDLVVLERREWGDFYGRVKEVRDGDAVLATGTDASWAKLQELLPKALDVHERALGIEKGKIGEVNFEKEKIRLAEKRLERKGTTSGPEFDRLKAKSAQLQGSYDTLLAQLQKVRSEVTARLVLVTVDGREKELPLTQVVRAFRPNEMGGLAKAGHYAANVWHFVSEDPRESNTEGGVFPAIFGTVLMVFLMSLVVTPLGVLTAFYLREYARQGAIVSAVRIAVNNLAGVPSIVYGVFGLGFFVYIVGGAIDRTFFAESLPTPTWGTGGILWASLTLALLTVPVVIVSAEEGLAAIPRGMREASLALGATKFETMWRVVLPAVMPSILTGLILAMARAAGEVAPLMITGVVKLAPSLPVDGYAPFVHFDRKFMHLGFHIYDVGFQSPNVDAARPMVYTTTILLLVLVVALNLSAIIIRNRLRKKLRTSGICASSATMEALTMTSPKPSVSVETRPPDPSAAPAAEKAMLIELEKFNFWYGEKQALFDIDLKVKERSVTAFIGPSGCGKSTLLRCLNRMNDLIDGVRVDGTLLVKGQSLYGPDVDVVDVRKRLGMVFQKSNPFPKSIFENVVYGLRIQGERNRTRLRDACESALKGAALWDEAKDRLDDSALSLSGGQMQRLCIARALAVEPEVVLMDEPCSALDPIATAKIEELIFSLKDRFTIVIVTHNMQQAARVSDETGFFMLGKLVEFDKTDVIFTRPRQKMTEDYITGRFG